MFRVAMPNEPTTLWSRFARVWFSNHLWHCHCALCDDAIWYRTHMPLPAWYLRWRRRRTGVATMHWCWHAIDHMLRGRHRPKELNLG